MRRTQNEMKSIEEICAVLDKCKVCRLAMNHNGYPYLVPMNFGYEREGNKIYLYFHGANAGTKKELIEKDGKCRNCRWYTKAGVSGKNHETLHRYSIWNAWKSHWKDNGNPRGSSNDYGEIP